LAGKVTLGKGLKGPLLANALLAEGADGYRVVFSLPEVDPAVTDKVVVVADRKDGKPLDDKEGVFRLIVPHDKLGMRWVRQLSRLSVRPAGPAVRLNLSGTAAADEQLALLSALPQLEELSLAGTKVTDAGLVRLQDLRKLKALHLADTATSDEGLERI